MGVLLEIIPLLWIPIILNISCDTDNKNLVGIYEVNEALFIPIGRHSPIVEHLRQESRLCPWFDLSLKKNRYDKWQCLSEKEQQKYSISIYS